MNSSRKKKRRMLFHRNFFQKPLKNDFCLFYLGYFSDFCFLEKICRPPLM